MPVFDGAGPERQPAVRGLGTADAGTCAAHSRAIGPDIAFYARRTGASGIPDAVTLQHLDLASNRIGSESDVYALASLPHLVSLRLVGNPIASHPGYRSMVASALPWLQYLDDR